MTLAFPARATLELSRGFERCRAYALPVPAELSRLVALPRS